MLRYLYSAIMIIFSIVSGCLAAPSVAVSQSRIIAENDLSQLIANIAKNPDFKKTPNLAFNLKALTLGGGLIAFRVPTRSNEWANSRVLFTCEKYTGDKIAEGQNTLFLDNQIFDISGPLDFWIPDDSASYEEMKIPYLHVLFKECNVKKLPSSELNAEIREIGLRNTREAIRVGPTFSCSDFAKCDPLSLVILAGAHGPLQLGALDVALIQPFQAMRGLPEVDQNALKIEAGKLAQQVKEKCRLPKRFKTDEVHGNIIVPDQITKCVVSLYQNQQQIWANKARSYNNNDLNEEIERTPNDHWFSQYLLLINGFLPKQGWPDSGITPIDGSFGAGTRTSIKAVQTEAGLPTTGFMNNATFNYLRSRDPSKVSR